MSDSHTNPTHLPLYREKVPRPSSKVNGRHLLVVKKAEGMGEVLSVESMRKFYRMKVFAEDEVHVTASTHSRQRQHNAEAVYQLVLVAVDRNSPSMIHFLCSARAASSGPTKEASTYMTRTKPSRSQRLHCIFQQREITWM